MRYLSDLTVAERASDCKDAAGDVIDLCESFVKTMSKINKQAVEIERQLRMTEADFEDPYDPVTKSLRLLEEIIDETD